MGLIALAVSDLCYCVSAAPKAFLKTRATTFRSGDFRNQCKCSVHDHNQNIYFCLYF